MKLTVSPILVILSLILSINISAQTNSIVIGEINESVYILDTVEHSQETPNFGNNYYYIDIDNNGIIDMTFDFHSHGNGWGGQGGVKVTCQDNTMVKINQKLVQFIGPCDDRYPDTTHNVHRLSMGDILSSTDYYQTSDHILYLSTWSYPCTIGSDIDDWEDGTYYLGFKKIINDTLHLGWIKIEEIGLWKMIFKEIAFTKPIPQRKYPIINEFLVWNSSNIQDEYDEYDSWIELFNPWQDSVLLGTLSLRGAVEDDSWQLPNVYMKPNGYLIIWADNQTYQGPLHGDIDLEHNNNQLALLDIHGSIIDKHYYLGHDRDVSEGRFPNASAGEWKKFPVPTPGMTNGYYANLKINEFMASNTSAIADEYGEFDDWIELFHTGGEDSAIIINYYLSDDPEYPKKWQLPNVFLQAGEYVLIWADNQTEQGKFHANFKLDDDGEMISLYDGDGNIVLDSIIFNSQSADISLGRFPNASNSWAYFTIPSPGDYNLPTSVDENISPQLKAYPNPTSDNIIYFNKEINCKVYNAYGQYLCDKNKINYINLEAYPSGIYLLETDKGESLRIIKLQK